MRLRTINVYPVKSLAGTEALSAKAEPWGLQHDRRWLVVDETGRFISQRVQPRMALILAEPFGGGLRLSLSGHGSVPVATPGAGAAPVRATVWRDTVDAVLADDEAHRWLSGALGQPCRLAYLHDTAARRVAPAFGLPGETVSFADGFPVLLTSESSLDALNARLLHAMPITRFRGNLVVAGAPAWDEDCWRRIRIGEAEFRVAKPCDRCIVTTIDQQTGLRPDRMEPLRTLGMFRHDERGIMFGQNLVPVVPGRVTAGDIVEVLERGPPNVVPIPGA